ncbi:MAG: tetratricopeptide repeat protein [Acidobacteria bacterium]|nr:tetratricopeptide repeat protein [Acidobacteriota bacterium]
MKRCPECRRDYYDDSQLYCLDDGSALLEGPASLDEPATAIFGVGSPSKASFRPSPNNLSEDISPLVGREKEIAGIERLLSLDNTRLLTLTGVGGTGKTRLAQAVAWRMLLNFPDGVFFVNLAPITDHKLVAPAIAQTLGVQESGNEPLLDALSSYFLEKKMLLVLDNFEQVSEAAAEIERLSSAVPNITFLITSREVLHLRAEREFVVPPLALPSDGESSTSHLSGYESIQFFVERARDLEPDFALTDANAGDVAAICRSLDGLPFAIELAAARIKLFEPHAIRSRLSNSLRFLTGGAKDQPERRQTMRGAIAWSYDLLDADEKRLLNTLSVFAGGFTIESAEAVGAGGGEILDTVTSLLDKNLIERMKQDGGDARFRMLVVVREFALEKLELSGDLVPVRERHATYFSELATVAEPELRGSRAAEWLQRLEREHENIRLALNWAIDRVPETALRIAASIQRFWWRRGHLSEGVEWTRRIIDATCASGDPKLLASAYRGISSLSWNRGDFDAAVAFAEKGLEIALKTGDKKLVINALHSVGTAKHNKGDFSSAREFSEKALVMAREAGEPFEAAELANALGELARHQEDHAAAGRHYEEALQIARQNGYKQLNMLAAINLAAVACQLEDYELSYAYTLESMKLSEEMGSTISIGYALERFAALAVISGEMERAALLSGAMEAIYDAAGYRIEEVDRLFLERYLDKARSAIGDERFEGSRDRGKAMSVADAVAFAREGEADWVSTRTLKISDNESSRMAGSAATKDQIPTTKDTEILSSEALDLPKATVRFKWQILALTAFVAVLAVGGYFGYQYFRSAGARQIRSIAVLPFDNRSGNGEADYLSDGLADSLIYRLSQLPDLKVSPTSSVMRYKGKNSDTMQIAKDLNVDAVMSGRLVQLGDSLNISVQLTDARTDKLIWAEQYDRKMTDLLATQREIASTIAQKLELKLAGDDSRGITKKYTDSSEAYQAYLKGRYYWNRRTADNIKTAIEQFKIAADKDPNFALAYAGLADCYAVRGEYAGTPTLESLPQATAYAERAITLDDQLAEPHATLGLIKKMEWKWADSEAAFKKAIEINPGYATSYHWYSILLRSLGRFEETAAVIKQAEKLDPLSSIIAVNVSDSYQMLNHHTASVEVMLKTIELDPTFSAAHENLGMSYLKLGRTAEGIEHLEKAVELSKRSAVRLRGLGYGYAVTGRRGEALAIAKEMEGKYARNESNGQYIASVYAGLGDKDKAFEWLEKDFSNHHGSLPDIVWRIHFESLRDDPRYKGLLKRMNLPE